MNNLIIEEREIGDVTVLDLDGNVRIDGTSVALAKAITRLIAQGRIQVVLNLARVDYIDSSGLGELISGKIGLNNKGGQIKLVNLTKRLFELMTITKLVTVFDIYDDESNAVDSFKTVEAVAFPGALPNVSSVIASPRLEARVEADNSLAQPV